MNTIIADYVSPVGQIVKTQVMDQCTSVFKSLSDAFENISLRIDPLLLDSSESEEIVWDPGSQPPLDSGLNRKSVRWNPIVSSHSEDGKQEVISLKEQAPPPVGELSYSDGKSYYGKHFNKIPNGWGMMTYPDHTQFMGIFKDGALNGWGIMTYPNGVQHIGEFRDGIPINEDELCATDELITEKNKGSIGQSSHSDGRVYYGKHVNSIPNGWGVMTCTNGTQFIGEFKNGSPNGWGIITYPTGAQHIGKFRDGILIDEDGLCATGGQNTEKNKRYVGELSLPDGRVYYGKHFNQIPNGWGKITYPNNMKFIGEFENGSLNGWGMCCTPDGQIIAEGQWDNGTKVL